MDEVHVAFVHRAGGSHAKLSQDLPVISAEEKDWGMLRIGKRASGKVRHTLHYAPNIVRVIVPPLAGMDGVGGWPEITSASPRSTMRMPLGADQQGPGRRQGRGGIARSAPNSIASAPRRRRCCERRHDLWSGKLHFADVTPSGSRGRSGHRGAGRPGPDRGPRARILGRSDAAIILWRRILARELRVIAEGAPRKRWTAPPADVVPIVGI